MCSPASVHLRRPGEVQVVAFVGAEDLLLVGRQEPGAEHRLLARTSTGGITGAWPCRGGDVQRVAHQRELQHHAVAREVDEPRPRDLRAPFQVQRASGLQQVHVVRTAEVEGRPLADRAQHHAVALLAVRGRRVGQVRHPDMGVGERRLGRGQRRLQLGDLLLEFRRSGDHGRAVGRRGAPDPLGRLLLPRPGSIDLSDQVAVGCFQLGQTGDVRRRPSAPRQCRRDAIEVFTQQTRIDHADGLLGCFGGHTNGAIGMLPLPVDRPAGAPPRLGRQASFATVTPHLECLCLPSTDVADHPATTRQEPPMSLTFVLSRVVPIVVIVLLSMTITRIATIALTMTGVSRQSARFQARSALTGAGFTTSESESMVNHPVRRRIIMWLMLTGNAGIVSVVGLLFVTTSSRLTDTSAGPWSTTGSWSWVGSRCSGSWAVHASTRRCHA